MRNIDDDKSQEILAYISPVLRIGTKMKPMMMECGDMRIVISSNGGKFRYRVTIRATMKAAMRWTEVVMDVDGDDINMELKWN